MRAQPLVAAGALLAALLPGAARAEDVWSDPFPGVRHLHRSGGGQNVHALAVDLCAPGVGVRATGSGERGRTVSAFGELVGAQAAVNGDFFGAGFATDGLAMSGGARWPGSADHGYTAPLAFGPHRVELLRHEEVAEPAPWMAEIVSGHPTILVGGAGRDNNGDPLCSNRNPRTAVGLSADRRTLYVAVVDGRAASRVGMTCDELAALMGGLGATDALNLDGGGSSTMWQAGAGVLNFPSDGSQRTVGNHLGIYASGTGDAPFCPNPPPRGFLDGAGCDALTGWAQDPDAPDAPVEVLLSFDGPAGAEGATAVSLRADGRRDDLCAAIGSCAHGFRLPPPGAFLDGRPHAVWAYGIDPVGGDAALLAGAPASVTCAPPAPPLAGPAGLRRHVANPEVLAGWRLHFYDVVTLPDEVVDAFAEGPAIDAPPRLVRAAGLPEVWLLDQGLRRRVAGDEALAAWHAAPSDVAELPAAELATYEPGPPLPAAPFLLRGSGPEVYLLDVRAEPTVEPGGDPGGAGLRGGCRTAPGGSGGAALLGLLLAAALAARGRSAAPPRRRRPR